MTMTDPVSPDLKRHLRALKLGQLTATLMPEHEQLGIFRPVTAEHQDDQAEHPARQQVDDLEQHPASQPPPCPSRWCPTGTR